VGKQLADLLLEESLLDEDGLQAARRIARREGVPLVVAATQEGRVEEAALAEALERRLKLPRVELGDAFVELDAVREVPHALAEERRLMPLALERAGGRRVLRVAMADPLDAQSIEEIESQSGCRVDPVIATPSEIEKAVARHYRGVTTKLIPRGAAAGGAPPAREREESVTQPHHRIEDGAPAELRVRALLAALIEKGVITDDEYLEALRKLLKDEG
jgi:hypothetical protein